MNGSEDLLTKRELLLAMDRESIRTPNIPVLKFIKEAEYLSAEAQKDKEALEGVGLDWNLVLDLLVRIGALRQAESIWFKSRYKEEELEREWDTKSNQGYELRDAMLHAFRYAFGEDEQLLRRVSEIASGRTDDDMVQDLSHLAELGRDYTQLLEAIRFPLAQLEQAANLSDELGTLMALAAGERSDTSEDLDLRNRAYTHLKEAVDKIRGAGQYVFWRDAERRQHYVSMYHRETRRGSRSGAADQGVVLES